VYVERAGLNPEMRMKIAEIVNIVEGKVICGHEFLQKDVHHAFSSDLLSDVLTINKPGIMLITGVANLQTVRTAEMAEVICVLLVRNKKTNEEMIRLASENGLMIIECAGSMFGVSGRLYQAGLKPLY
jgi:predicted transcriptional regulator